MKAIRVSTVGGPEVLEPSDVPEPELLPGTARVAQRAIGVNFVEVYQRSGQYGLSVPFVPGSEGAGVVTAIKE